MDAIDTILKHTFQFRGSKDIALLQQQVIIYGAGYCGCMFLEFMKDAGGNVICFFDKNPDKAGLTIMGVNVRQPGALKECGPNVLIVVCLLAKGESYRAIKQKLSKIGYHNITHIYDYREYHEFFKKQNLLLSADMQFLSKNRSHIKAVCELLEDNLSKKTYYDILHFLCIDADFSVDSFPIKEQYFAYDLFRKNKDEVLVDCGALNGTVMDIFIEKNNDFKQYIAFEPDSYNADMIRLKQERYKGYPIDLYENALGDKQKVVRLMNYCNENAVIKPDGEQRVNCVPLDDYIAKIEPTFIKIDVEGYELKLLYGARKIIEKNKPLIAIAIYHKESDLWEIPFYIKKLLPDHKLYLRSYMNIMETVLYAVPPERCLHK